MKKLIKKNSIFRTVPVFLISFILISGIVMATDKVEEKKMCDNPFFKKYETPFEVPPFNLITEDHYIPAFKKGMADHKKEIDAIINCKKKPDFVNTIEALENSGELLSKVANVFFSLYSSLTNQRMQEIAKEMSPLLSKHQDDINLSEDLFKKVKSVYENSEKFDLNLEQKKVLEEYYKGFVRGGANLNRVSSPVLYSISPLIPSAV